MVADRDTSALSKVQVSKHRKTSESTGLCNGLPSIIKEQNKKDNLYNAILKFLLAQGLSWDEPNVHGKPFVQDLCHILWYLDGHHDVMASRSCPIPSALSHFVGFNKPELSKHRKRSISNLNHNKLDEYAFVLQEYLISSWMQQEEWVLFRKSLQTLFESLASYSSYLATRNKAMKVHHASPEPAVSFSDAFSLKHITQASSISPLLVALHQALKNSGCYQKLCVSDFSPRDRRRRYLFIRELEKGVSIPVFLLTYTHGSSIGNLHFVWRAPLSIHKEAATIENSCVVEEIKLQIPVYHTCAMKREFCELYGRISHESKPYLLRSIYCALTGDQLASRTTAESEVDACIKEALLAEDSDILDLREVNTNG